MERHQISRSVRGWIADRQKGLCRSCDEPLGRFFHIDHIIPLAAYTEKEAATHGLLNLHHHMNLQALCGTCHIIKSGYESLPMHKRRLLRRDGPSSTNLCFYCGVLYSTHFAHACYKDGLSLVKIPVHYKEWHRVG